MSDIPEINKEQQGFFVKIRDDCYRGPFELLSGARSIGPDFEIYHGVLKILSETFSESIIDSSKLFLVPKLKKNK